jgi:hypothetical protein
MTKSGEQQDHGLPAGLRGGTFAIASPQDDEARYRAGRRWRRARNEAANLAQCMQGSSWAARAQLADRFLWYETRAGLSSDQVTAVINRLADAPDRMGDLAHHMRYCKAVLTGALAVLGDVLPVASDQHALLLLLSDKAGHRDAAEAWITTSGRDLQPALSRLPGHAFMLLALDPNDSAISFLARDAFRLALLGQD